MIFLMVMGAMMAWTSSQTAASLVVGDNMVSR
jgi:hypothetical protein